MTRRGFGAPGRAAILAACLAATAPAAPSPAAEARLMLSGSDSAVWLVRVQDEAGTFDIAVRETGGAWKWVSRKLTGKPSQIVAGRHKLHVLFAPRLEHLIFDESGESQPAVTPTDPRWPADAAPAAMGPWQDANTGQFVGLLAVVPRPASGPQGPAGTTRRSATAPTTAAAPSTVPAASMPDTGPASTRLGRGASTRGGGYRGLRAVTLGVFNRLEGRWRHVADLPDVTIADSARIVATSAAGRVYVLVADEGRIANRLYEWSGGPWRKIALPDPTGDEPPLALVTVSRRVVAVLTAPADPNGLRKLTIVELEPHARKIATRTMLLRGKPATFALGASPKVSRLGGQLALLWRKDGELLFGTCQPQQGELVPKGKPVDVFDRAPSDGLAEQLLANFTWALVIAVLILTVLFRPRGAAEPFLLPPGVRNAGIVKRLAALVLDMLPCYLAVGLVFRFVVGERRVMELWEKFLRAWREGSPGDVPLSIEVAVANIAPLVALMLYGLVTEARFGATPGKMLMRLRVVGNGASRPTLRQYLVRNLMKGVELSPMSLLIMLAIVSIVVLVTRYNQRLGDLLARTAVIDATAAPGPRKPEDATASPPLPPDDAESPAEPRDEPPQRPEP